MNGIELLIEEHKYVRRMLLVIRKACFKLIETGEINYDDFYNMIHFVRNFADNHHHKKEEVFLFNKMVENLGETGKNIITHGMLVEHDLGRNYMRNLEAALEELKQGNEEAKLDVIANAVSYTTLLDNHITKEDKVIFTYAQRALDKELLKVINEECFEYEEKNINTRKENIGILNTLEDKYIK